MITDYLLLSHYRTFLRPRVLTLHYYALHYTGSSVTMVLGIIRRGYIISLARIQHFQQCVSFSTGTGYSANSASIVNPVVSIATHSKHIFKAENNPISKMDYGEATSHVSPLADKKHSPLPAISARVRSVGQAKTCCRKGCLKCVDTPSYRERTLGRKFRWFVCRRSMLLIMPNNILLATIVHCFNITISAISRSPRIIFDYLIQIASYFNLLPCACDGE